MAQKNSERAASHGKTSSIPVEQKPLRRRPLVLGQQRRAIFNLAHRDNALGWKDVGPSGSKAECLEYIETVLLRALVWEKGRRSSVTAGDIFEIKRRFRDDGHEGLFCKLELTAP